MRSLIDPLARLAATAAYQVLRLARRQRPTPPGAHAIALTPDDRIVLVRLRYAPGWRLPGGGRIGGEDATQAALREMREEIGLLSHGEVRLAAAPSDKKRNGRGGPSLVIVRDVAYRPRRWSWEIEAVREADLDGLPADMSPLARRMVKSVRPQL